MYLSYCSWWVPWITKDGDTVVAGLVGAFTSTTAVGYFTVNRPEGPTSLTQPVLTEGWLFLLL